MTRSVAVCVAAVVALGVGTPTVSADGMPLPNGVEITFFRLFITESGEVKEPTDDETLRRYFNLAHCVCSQSNAGNETAFEYELTTNADTGLPNGVELWIGTDCANINDREDRCVPVGMTGDVDNLMTGQRFSIKTYDAVNVVRNMDACAQEEPDRLLWAVVDFMPVDGTPDYWKTYPIAQTPTAMDIDGIDTLPPPLPGGFKASPGEGAIQISWTPEEGREDDVYYYQAMCSKTDDSVAEPDDVPEALYDTPTSVCGANVMIDLVPTEIASDGEPVSELPPQFATLDDAFLCGQAQGTARAVDIKGLENGVPYKVALLVVDFSGNVRGTYFTRTVTPKPVIDLWEDIHDRNGTIDGGCLIAETYGNGSPLTELLRRFRDDTLARTAFGRALIDAYYATLGKLGAVVHGSLVLRALAAIAIAPLAVIAIAWHVLTLPGLVALLALAWLWRRRRRSRRLALAAAFACVALPQIAAADDFTPYWEDPTNEAAALREPDDVKWHAGIRIGPYIPDIDLQAGQNAITGWGPYEALFGDYVIDGNVHEQKVYQIMPMLDVDRVLWRRSGQILVGGTLGYMQKSAYGYLDGTSEDDPRRPRANAGKTTFRLIPFALTATYRATQLDDLWGIPVVPYLKAGLAYYAWWMTAPGGETSKVCEGTEETMCDTARGGSLGYQGSIGVSIRAERIDADAAMSMRNSGIQHAGFYAELYWAKVDGFGSSSRLAVGDTTWFAGVDFEF